MPRLKDYFCHNDLFYVYENVVYCRFSPYPVAAEVVTEECGAYYVRGKHEERRAHQHGHGLGYAVLAMVPFYIDAD